MFQIPDSLVVQVVVVSPVPIFLCLCTADRACPELILNPDIIQHMQRTCLDDSKMQSAAYSSLIIIKSAGKSC